MRNNDNCNEKGQHLQGNVIKLIIILLWLLNISGLETYDCQLQYAKLFGLNCN